MYGAIRHSKAAQTKPIKMALVVIPLDELSVGILRKECGDSNDFAYTKSASRSIKIIRGIIK